ncbi:hypothetical protein L1887_39027 [Cichorium endivia]|nr:hypothetical protein L1887_39027 [Cichorium endivia]
MGPSSLLNIHITPTSMFIFAYPTLPRPLVSIYEAIYHIAISATNIPYSTPIMKKINLMLRKCKTLSRQLVRTSSYTTLRSKSTTDHHRPAESGGIMWNTSTVSVYAGGEEPRATVFVGSTRKRYVIGSKYLSHPLIIALTQKSTSVDVDGDNAVSVINCEVVLFDHLLWMLENSDLNVTSDSLDELADLYLS